MDTGVGELGRKASKASLSTSGATGAHSPAGQAHLNGLCNCQQGYRWRFTGHQAGGGVPTSALSKVGIL